jgi:hypothetical protein
MEDRSCEGRRGEQGFALVLAILSLMLLTFLGLTMATTTSTELQIATNYRWSQQALYNAEAGLEAARIVLSSVADVSTQWQGSLPPPRTTWWDPATPTGPAGPVTGRDYERWECDERGLGVGYGLVLSDLTGVRYENRTDYAGLTLNGAFTIWIRRPLLTNNAGQYSEDPAENSRLVIVSEGVAPYSGGTDALIRSRQAVRVLETRFTLGLATAGEPCGLGAGQGQEGGSAMGENFNPCVNVTPGAGGTLEPVFGGPGGGALTSNPDAQ